tara:strand:+ start:103 stop:492 length:390 start_codon:yes stop_codon:yes gene_type:complete
MIKKKVISTKNAPSAIGSYSQAIKAGDFIYISGQIPLDPETMEIVSDNFEVQVKQVLNNLNAIVVEAGYHISDIIKLNVYLKNLENFQSVNNAMSDLFKEPYPARAAVEVSRLPRDVLVEMDAIVYTGD